VQQCAPFLYETERTFLLLGFLNIINNADISAAFAQRANLRAQFLMRRMNRIGL
jgi:hypothetical protein